MLLDSYMSGFYTAQNLEKIGRKYENKYNCME